MGEMGEMTNGLLRQRLVGLAVLLVLVFLLSLLLPGKPEPAEELPSTTVSISGEQLLTEADAVPPPDDLPPEPIDAAGSDSPPPADTAVAISDVERLAEPAPAPASPPAAPPPATLKLAPKVGVHRGQDVAEPKPSAKTVDKSPEKPAEKAADKPIDKPAKPPAVAAITPKPKLAESVAKAPVKAAATEASPGWYVQIGSFSDAGSAQTIVSLLKKLGVSAGITRIKGVKGNPLNRVRAGPYASESAAKAAHARIARNGYPQSRIVQEPSH